jgi:flagellar biosynthesis/type III secretory pathway M-ring protein FliF/YscJ
VALWVWIVVVAGVALIIWLLIALIGTPARRRAAQREKAETLRREAEQKLASAARREVAAKREAELAEREREDAEHAIAQAAAVDPDLADLSSDGTRPDEVDRITEPRA